MFDEEASSDMELQKMSTGSASPIQTKPSCQKTSKWSSLSQNSWFWETVSIFFSILCFVTIVILLLFNNNKKSPLEFHGLTINTIISILATGSKSSLIFVVSASIGQLKWLWLQKERRRVYDIQAFDDASRGPLGSLTILFSHKAQSIVSLGAIITVLGLLFDPFMQQVASLPAGVFSSHSVVATANQLEGWNFSDIAFSLNQAYNGALWGNNIDINPICASGNCTWPPYQSVAVCSKCEDVTPTATLHGCDNIKFDYNINDAQSIPCNITLSHGAGVSTPILVERMPSYNELYKIEFPNNLTWSTYNPESDNASSGSNVLYAGVQNPLQAFAHAELKVSNLINGTQLSDSGNGMEIIKATECALSFCSKTYSMAVVNGVPSVTTSDADLGESVHPEQFASGLYWKSSNYSPPWHSQEGMASPSQLFVYRDGGGITKFAFGPVLDFLSGVNTSFTGQDYQVWEQEASRNLTTWKYNGISVDSPDNFKQVMTLGLPKVVGNIADSLTNWATDRSKTTVSGIMLVQESSVSANWAWLILPTLVLILSIVFFILTVKVNKQQKDELWKCSVLPVLYHGLDNDLLDDDDPYPTISDMERSARSIAVRLERSNGGRLMLR